MKTYDPNANPITIICMCGHRLNFLKAHPRRCSNCGKIVVPVQKKILKKM